MFVFGYVFTITNKKVPGQKVPSAGQKVPSAGQKVPSAGHTLF